MFLFISVLVYNFQNTISVLAWQFDIWKFTTKPFNGTNVLVSGWNVITYHQPPINTTCLFPAGGSKGTLTTCSKVHRWTEGMA